MTSGTQTIGAIPGYYKHRQWNGADGSHSDEHNYTWWVDERFLPPVQFKPYPGYPGWLDGSMWTFCPGLPQLYTDKTVGLVNCATNKVFVLLAQSEFNAGVFGGEFKQTYRQLANIVTTIGRGLLRLKAGDAAGALRIWAPKGSYTGVAANSYMAVHFGLIPLTQDIRAAYQFLVNDYRIVKRVRKKCVWKDDALLTQNGVQWRWEAVAIAEVRGEVSMSELSPCDRLSLNDIPSVIWELTTYSWLVDWLIPVGNFLAAVNASNRTAGQVFAVTRMQREALWAPMNLGKYEIRGFDGSSFCKHYGPGPLNSRSVLTGLPWKFPTIQNPLGDNLSRWVTATAFLRQAVGR